MSYLLGNPAHQCYVCPDFDKAIKKFTAAGIGPVFVFDEDGVVNHYRGEKLSFTTQVAFVYSGDSCIENIAPNDAGVRPSKSETSLYHVISVSAVIASAPMVT